MEIRYFGKYKEDGSYDGFYTTDIWKEEDIPSGCIELTHDQWQEALSVKCYVVNGVHTVVMKTQEELNSELLAVLRAYRDKLLSECDWTQMLDSPLSEEKKLEWATYRQALRDLPATVDINNIVYPAKPN